MGRHKESSEPTERVVEVKMKTLDEEEDETLGLRRSLANRNLDVGWGQESLQLMEQVVEAYKKRPRVKNIPTLLERCIISLWAIVKWDDNSKPHNLRGWGRGW